jgi:hypothetical protein
MTLSTADRLAIHELMALHGHVADDRRADLLDQLLTEDAVYDLAAYDMGQVVGLPELRRLFEEAPGDQPLAHLVTNVIVTEDADGTVRVRSKGLAVMPNGAAGAALYDDKVVPTEAGWRIAHRTVVPARRPDGGTRSGR